MKGFGLDLTNGWANTAKPHKTAGFDLGIVAGLAFVPDKDLMYSAANLRILQVNGDTVYQRYLDLILLQILAFKETQQE